MRRGLDLTRSRLVLGVKMTSSVSDRDAAHAATRLSVELDWSLSVWAVQQMI